MTKTEAIAELSVLHERLSNPKDCEDGCYLWEDGWYVEAIDMAIEALSEPKTGEWIFNPKDAIELMFAKPKCSECGFESADGGNFCPNCGARMRGLEE